MSNFGHKSTEGHFSAVSQVSLSTVFISPFGGKENYILHI